MSMVWYIIPSIRSVEKIEFKWEKPKDGRLKMNSDGSLKDGIGRWGAAVRDWNGDVIMVAYVDRLKTIKELMRNFTEVSIQHFYREVNGLAYTLAAIQDVHRYVEMEYGELPLDCKKSILEEKSGKLYESFITSYFNTRR